MSDVVNLRQARKARQRAKDAATADANRMKFGRTTAQKRLDSDTAARADRHLAAIKRETD